MRLSNSRSPEANLTDNVAAVLGTLRKVGLERIIHSRQHRERDLVVAMIVARIVEPGSKLATARGLSKRTLTSSLGECVGVEDSNEDESTGPADEFGPARTTNPRLHSPWND